MKSSKIVAYAICALSLSACGGVTSNKMTDPVREEQGNHNGQSANEPNPTSPTAPAKPKLGSLQGTVRSEITDLAACQVYLYEKSVSNYADAFDAQHPNFKMPHTAISGTAPVAFTEIADSGVYQFSNVEIGEYQVLLNCIDAEGVQDQSSLKDDPIQYDGLIMPNPKAIIPHKFILTISEDSTSIQDFIDTREKPKVDLTAGVIIRADMTNSANVNAPLYDMWRTVNRITPKVGDTAVAGMRMNAIRMLGGVTKTLDGKKVPDLEYDVASYNESTGQYEYNFQPLLARVDAIVKHGQLLHQLVVDQPPWAFQHGHSFIPDSHVYDGISFKESQRVSYYGNSLPPADKAAYNQFLQAMMHRLIQEYGRDNVAKWRFRIGSEIETPDHWYGTEQDFVEHFVNSAQAIRAVLPEAIIGVHTRGPNFVYKNGTVTNYKGEPIKAFSNAIIESAHEHKIKIDFWGVSDYPFINIANTRDPKTKFEQFFKPMLDHPKWQAATIIDIEEFSIITRMGGVPNANVAYITSDSPQANTFAVALTDEFYQHNISEVFLWGYRNGERPFYITQFESMFGLPRISTHIKTQHNENIDSIGAIVVNNPSDHSIQAVTYHYDPADLEAKNEREIQLSFATHAPVGATYFYRNKLEAPEHHVFYGFMSNTMAANWLRTDQNYFSKYGNPNVDLNDLGKNAWQHYQHNKQSSWTSWQSAITVARQDGKRGSQIHLNSLLPMFSYQKTEIKWVAQ